MAMPQRRQAELQPERIVMTIELLSERIDTRLPGRGLPKVARRADGGG